MQFKGLFVQLTHICAVDQLLKIPLQLNQLIIQSSVVWNYGYSILQLIDIRKRSVIHQNEA